MCCVVPSVSSLVFGMSEGRPDHDDVHIFKSGFFLWTNSVIFHFVINRGAEHGLS